MPRDAAEDRNTTLLDHETIQKAGQALQRAAPGSRVILFGSYARGDARGNSDLDFVVIEPQVRARRAEMVRLSDVLRVLGVQADVLVVSEEGFRQWSQVPGTVLYEVAREGQVVGSST